MDAAVLHAWGTPVFGAFHDPSPADGQVVVEVEAAAVNPVDLLIASGQFYIRPAELPYVVGTDGVGRLADGRRVYFGASALPFGGAAQRTLVSEAALIDLADGVDAAIAATLGNTGLAAWLSLQWRARLAPGETVLVLGATGAVGRLAVQAAKLLGADRVVAVGRDADGLRRALELGADEALDVGDLEQPRGTGVDVIVDLLWGAPAAAALQWAAPGARLVQIGQSAGPESPLAAGTLRSRRVDIMGFANYHAAADVRAAVYGELVDLAATGRLVVDVERVALADVADAWRRQRAGAGHKLVLVP
jgi:NADPH:quinone reductase-like Zn-dependent oxidoreductase